MENFNIMAIKLSNRRTIYLNNELIKRQQLSKSDVLKLAELHLQKETIFDAVKRNKIEDININYVLTELRRIEYSMQTLWRFSADGKYHLTQFYLDKCTCPYLDNKDSNGHHKYFNTGCPFHGDR